VRLRSLALALLAAAASPSPTWAGTGAIELNQTCALSAAGCVPGEDTGGSFPISLSSAGSYRLTSNLVVPDEETDAIDVRGSSIAIDLNGFCSAIRPR